MKMVFLNLLLLTAESAERAAHGGFYNLPWRDVVAQGLPDPDARDYFRHNPPPNLSSFEESSPNSHFYILRQEFLNGPRATGGILWIPEESNDALEVALDAEKFSIVRLLIEEFGFDSRGSLQKYLTLRHRQPGPTRNVELIKYLFGREGNPFLDKAFMLDQVRCWDQRLHIAEFILAKSPNSLKLSFFINCRAYVRLLLSHGVKPCLEDFGFYPNNLSLDVFWDLFRCAEPQVCAAASQGPSPLRELITQAKEQRLRELFHVAVLSKKLNYKLPHWNVIPFLWKEVKHQHHPAAQLEDSIPKITPVQVLPEILPLVESKKIPKESLLAIFIDATADPDMVEKMLKTLAEKMKGKPRPVKRTIKDVFTHSKGVEEWGWWFDMEMKRNESFKESWKELQKVLNERS